VLTSQEGKIYFVAQYNYFVDLADIELEMIKDGKFQQYLEKYKRNQEALNIIKTSIPYNRYFLPFTMCLISAKSYQAQFFRILEHLYKNFVYNANVLELKKGEMTLE
jgi:hypothetical protein